MRKSGRAVGAIVVFLALAFALPASVALAGQGRGNGPAKKTEKTVKADKHDGKDKNKDKDKDGKKDGRAAVIAVDRDGHLRVIREYAHGGSLPPGLAKRQALPPGLREQLRETGQLPPGLQKRLVLVPVSLGRRCRRCRLTTAVFAGDDLLVIDSRTNQIVAILRDVWR